VVAQALGHHWQVTNEVLVDDLWRYGGTLEVLGRRGPISRFSRWHAQALLGISLVHRIERRVAKLLAGGI